MNNSKQAAPQLKKNKEKKKKIWIKPIDIANSFDIAHKANIFMRVRRDQYQRKMDCPICITIQKK